MANSAQWAQFFSGKYKIIVDGIHAHDATLAFSVRNQYCMRVNMSPINVQGGASGFFHLFHHKCPDHMGDYQGIGPLHGGLMECRYQGAKGEKGWFHVGCFEEPPFPADWRVHVVWRGSLFVKSPQEKKSSLEMHAYSKRRRLETNYPWNL